LQDAAKDAIAKCLPTCEDLKYLFMNMADDKKKIESTSRLVFDTKVVTGIDIRRVMFVFECFLDKIVDPNLHGPEQCI
jgi:hypothetical protein